MNAVDRLIVGKNAEVCKFIQFIPPTTWWQKTMNNTRFLFLSVRQIAKLVFILDLRIRYHQTGIQAV